VLGLVHASNTSFAGPLTVRVTTSSRSDVRTTVVLRDLHRSGPLSRSFSSSTTCPARRSARPELAVAIDPRRLLFQPALAERAGPHAPDLLRRDQPGLLQHADVLLHAREGHVELLGEVRDRSVPSPELLQHAAPGRIRERGERDVELLALRMLNHLVQY
jgi:hypothetical protein